MRLNLPSRLTTKRILKIGLMAIILTLMACGRIEWPQPVKDLPYTVGDWVVMKDYPTCEAQVIHLIGPNRQSVSILF